MGADQYHDAMPWTDEGVTGRADSPKGRRLLAGPNAMLEAA
jgi:hypothetical protein